MNKQRVLEVLQTLVDEYGGRSFDRLSYKLGDLLPIEEQNQEIADAMQLIEELKNAN